MDKKNLYVIASEHFAKSLPLDLQLRYLEPVVETRAEILHAIGSCLPEFSYFADSQTEAIANDINELVEEAYRTFRVKPTVCDQTVLKQQAREILFTPNEDIFHREPVQYDNSHMICSLIRLAMAGNKVKVIPTELAGEIGSNHPIEKRDETMYQNVMKYGTEHNVLWVGSDHNLVSLAIEEEINFYRIDLQRILPRKIRVHGRLPEFMEPAYTPLRNSLMQENNIKFDSVVRFADL